MAERRPKFTPQEYKTLVDALKSIEDLRENGRTFAERHGA